LGDVHIVVPIRLHLGVLLAPDLPVNARGLTIPSLRKQVFFFVFFLIDQAYKYFAVGPDILHWNTNKEFYVRILSIHWILAVNNAMLVTVVPLVNYPVVLPFDFQSLCYPFRIKLVKNIVLLKNKVIYALMDMCLGCRQLPVLELPIKLFLPLTNDPPSKVYQVVVGVILVPEWGLQTTS
jgi:hypothetical protein